jgi:GNAT superfamily N-acetyltransferase
VGGIGDTEIAALAPPELLANRHDLSVFTSGEPTLDDWLRRRARANQLSGASRTYVLAQVEGVIGYYSLAAGAITVSEAPGRLRRNMPDPIPMAVLGRLAINQAWQGRGLGRLLLRDAVLRTAQASAIVGVRGVLVHALSPAAQRFYETHGFRESPANPMTLVVSLGMHSRRCAATNAVSVNPVRRGGAGSSRR